MLRRVDELFIYQRARGDYPRYLPIKQKAPGAYFVLRFDSEFFTDSHILTEILDKHFEKTIQLEVGEASHRHRPTIGLFGRKFEAK